ncbi:putative zinc finger protein [Orchesella cincta]|uniref:Putative zinc finger protein n=1 Tax=Orchesella cincta TaxID=48709 RepID=A0A1D2M812_ORCCI|nr:putative zinc finger protein [Orchesella cincta]
MAKLKGKGKDEELEREPNKRKFPVRKLVVKGGRSGYRCTRGDCRRVFYTQGTFQLHISNHEKVDMKDETRSEEEEEKEKKVEVPRKKTKRTQEARIVEKMEAVPKGRMSVTARNKQTSVPCDKAGCRRLFNSKKGLNIHTRDHEQEEREEVSEDEEDVENPGENGKIDIPWASTLHCGVCDTKPQFSSMAELESHRELTHPNYFNSKQCPRCPKSFGHVCLMNIHLRSHTGEKPYSCPSCDKCFSRKTRARQHHNYVHTTVRRYPCSKCEKSFKTSNGLNNHTKFVHDKETNSKYACTNCTAKFAKKEHLLSHAETHKKPLERQRDSSPGGISMRKATTSTSFFNCAYCQLQLGNRHYLRCHLKTTKHLNTVETFEEVKNYPGCSQALAEEEVALAPIYECKSCESTYSSEELLTQHVELVHEGKGRLICAKCRVEFKTRRYLTRHLSRGTCERAVKRAAKKNKKKSLINPSKM